ncbi:uncharacterized protein BP5553_07306 [Venustampulla echinocandica]|uniref:Uncharacterized protein n=1 Tax=Venustampulla echinocandica TaxID=2656787 RepID=A0A370TJ41_9HELO|nr:uncharacterized protein BP5553_07306 [Venustampulla echinocandica]RDL35375.1 hypothetical protein BP5553_07306 [Venustampulla echinocandica]
MLTMFNAIGYTVESELQRTHLLMGAFNAHQLSWFVDFMLLPGVCYFAWKNFFASAGWPKNREGRARLKPHENRPFYVEEYGPTSYIEGGAAEIPEDLPPQTHTMFKALTGERNANPRVRTPPGDILPTILLMKITAAFVLGSLISATAAHSESGDGNAGLPKFMGARKLLSEMKARNALPHPLEATVQAEKRQPVKAETLEERQDSNGRCGPGFGKCATNCCSPAGYCGLGTEYCAAPDCQLDYGPACDGNQKPAGTSTANIARPKIGNVPYGGGGIYDCVVPGDIAFTFDDGPYIYTSDLLDKLKTHNAKATFFITGNNLGKGPIDSTAQWSNLIKRMVAEGHQVASHTWSHQSLTSVDETTFNNQIIYNEMAFRNILGYFPTYMRPPYSQCDATCGSRLATLGYHVTYFDLDTAGYLNDDVNLIQNSKNIWDTAINPSNSQTDNFLEIEHDIHFQTVYNLTDYILASMTQHGYKSVTVGECLGDPSANWYRSTDSGTPPTDPTQTVSTDGSCSASVTCLGSTFGNCCSEHSYCGSTSAYCGTGCQPASGNCGSNTTPTQVLLLEIAAPRMGIAVPLPHIVVQVVSRHQEAADLAHHLSPLVRMVHVLVQLLVKGLPLETAAHSMGFAGPPPGIVRHSNLPALYEVPNSIPLPQFWLRSKNSEPSNCRGTKYVAMESEIRGLDLEKELTCSICTEVLYQPLTLLDCLHTFCGSCLKEWFNWQLTAARNSPNSLPAGSTPYTCPSCRAPVRASRHDARVTTLLEMFLVANPSKGKTDEEKSELKKKYTPGEDVIPKVEAKDKSIRERRVDDEDRRLMEEVRDLSLREVGVESSDARRERRRREEARLRPSRRDSSREHSRDSRSGDDRDRQRRREADSGRRGTRDDPRSDTESGTERRRRRNNEEARRRHEETSRTAARQIEHQSSLRSLISSSDIDSQEMEEEILRQIREEGLLDGIDLENIDVSQEDQISERIAEAFRRRQSERSREQRERQRSNDRRRQARSSAPESRETSGDDSGRTPRRRTHTRNSSAVSDTDGPSRPPTSISAAHAAHLEVQPSEERRRRRTTSGSRSSTAHVIGTQAQTRPAARSQTDLSIRSGSMDLGTSRPTITSGLRTSTETNRQHGSVGTASELESRESQTQPNSSPRMRTSPRLQQPATASISQTRRAPPAEIFVPASIPSSASLHSPGEQSLMPAPLSPSHAPRTSLSDRAMALSSGSRPTSSSSMVSRSRAPLYPEPSLTCARCSKVHIEYELHYNCGICRGENYNICLSCFRSGKGCLHWFGFGYAAWSRWEALTQSGDLPPNAEKPHMLIASRYIPPKISPGGADGRKTLTTEDPQKRLQSGTFCANCLAWANECYWRCDFCNEGDWGFCNLCVNRGECCTHPLLPLTFKPPESDSPPLSPTRAQQMPSSATILTGPGVLDIGRFKPLTFSVQCDICHHPIQPSKTRYHCFSCTSKTPNTLPGDYDICTTCYPKLVTSRRVSAENGIKGWRRCLQGHRMVVLGFEDNRGGQRRSIAQDLVGGRMLKEEPYNSSDYSDLQKWSWEDEKHVKLVTKNVMDTSPINVLDLAIDNDFPTDGGVGMSCFARWSWYPAPGVDDELMFPKGAEIRECKEVNAEWWYGTYMGKTGLFPALYVRILDRAPGS